VPKQEKIALVLQGGGALDAYQASAFEALVAGGYCPEWFAGISIGAINAAIICGNPRKARHAAARILGGDDERRSSPLQSYRILGLIFVDASANLSATFAAPGSFTSRLR
jgi:NTE family protein